jgi:hypothetical protein
MTISTNWKSRSFSLKTALHLEITPAEEEGIGIEEHNRWLGLIKELKVRRKVFLKIGQMPNVAF